MSSEIFENYTIGLYSSITVTRHTGRKERNGEDRRILSTGKRVSFEIFMSSDYNELNLRITCYKCMSVAL